MPQFHRPRAGLFLGLTIAAVVLLTLGAAVVHFADPPRAQADAAGNGYVVANEAGEPVRYEISIGEEGRTLLAEGDLEAGARHVVPGTAGPTLLRVHVQAYTAIVRTTCYDSTGAGLGVVIHAEPLRVQCVRLA